MKSRTERRRAPTAHKMSDRNKGGRSAEELTC
jgi:hypothetical protein